MKTFLALLLATLCAATGYGQTIKALSYNVSNSQVIWTNTNTAITFDNINASTIGLAGGFAMDFGSGFILDSGATNFSFGGTWFVPIAFSSAQIAATTRTNLGLGATNSVTFNRVAVGATNVPQNPIGGFVAQNGSGEEFHINSGGFTFYQGTNTGGSLEAEGRIFSGGVWTFENGASTRGNIVITNQTATNNGLLFVYRTNNEPFLGLANLIASNNTTISNETLFRVGTAEATNRSAQFGFRSTNTNGSGVAVFSVFGYNALMMVGVDASTNAVIYSGGGTNNEVMTLIKSGVTEFARPISFSTTAHAAATRTNLALGATSDPTFRDVSVRDLSIVGGSGGKIVYPSTNTAPTNTTNVVTWIQVNVGTNSYRVPLYQ
jgi:hypothetical protein